VSTVYLSDVIAREVCISSFYTNPVNTNYFKSGDTQQNYRKIGKARTRLRVACISDAGKIQLSERCPATN